MGSPLMVEQRQTGLGALLVDREDAALDGRQMALGEARLPSMR